MAAKFLVELSFVYDVLKRFLCRALKREPTDGFKVVAAEIIAFLLPVFRSSVHTEAKKYSIAVCCLWGDHAANAGQNVLED